MSFFEPDVSQDPKVLKSLAANRNGMVLNELGQVVGVSGLDETQLEILRRRFSEQAHDKKCTRRIKIEGIEKTIPTVIFAAVFATVCGAGFKMEEKPPASFVANPLAQKQIAHWSSNRDMLRGVGTLGTLASLSIVAFGLGRTRRELSSIAADCQISKGNLRVIEEEIEHRNGPILGLA